MFVQFLVVPQHRSCRFEAFRSSPPGNRLVEPCSPSHGGMGRTCVWAMRFFASFFYQSTRRRPTLPLQPPGRLYLRRRSQLPLLRNSLRRSVRQPHQPRKGSGRITRCLMVWLFAFPCRSIPFPSGGGPLPGTPVPHHGTYRASVSGPCCATIYILTVRSCGVGRPPRAPTDGLAVTPLPKRVRGGWDSM